MLLGLYGAGATGKMLYDQLEVDPNIAEEFEKVVFIDDTPGLTKSYGLEVYSFEDTLKLYSPDDLKFLVTLGNPKARETVWKKNEVIWLSGDNLGPSRGFCVTFSRNRRRRHY